MTDINNNDAIHGDEDFEDFEPYQGSEDHLRDAEVSHDAATHAQEALHRACCDPFNDAASDIIKEIDSCEELRQLLFKVLNVGNPKDLNQRDLINKLEVKLAKEFDK